MLYVYTSCYIDLVFIITVNPLLACYSYSLSSYRGLYFFMIFLCVYYQTPNLTWTLAASTAGRAAAAAKENLLRHTLIRFSFNSRTRRFLIKRVFTIAA